MTYMVASPGAPPGQPVVASAGGRIDFARFAVFFPGHASPTAASIGASSVPTTASRMRRSVGRSITIRCRVLSAVPTISTICVRSTSDERSLGGILGNALGGVKSGGKVLTEPPLQAASQSRADLFSCRKTRNGPPR